MQGYLCEVIKAFHFLVFKKKMKKKKMKTYGKKSTGKSLFNRERSLLLFAHARTRGNPHYGSRHFRSKHPKKGREPQLPLAHAHAITSDSTTTSNVTLEPHIYYWYIFNIWTKVFFTLAYELIDPWLERLNNTSILFFVHYNLCTLF
jgi:hypothetical protein